VMTRSAPTRSALPPIGAAPDRRCSRAALLPPCTRHPCAGQGAGRRAGRELAREARLGMIGPERRLQMRRGRRERFARLCGVALRQQGAPERQIRASHRARPGVRRCRLPSNASARRASPRSASARASSGRLASRSRSACASAAAADNRTRRSLPQSPPRGSRATRPADRGPTRCPPRPATRST
jgi:hypothetical protein